MGISNNHRDAGQRRDVCRGALRIAAGNDNSCAGFSRWMRRTACRRSSSAAEVTVHVFRTTSSASFADEAHSRHGLANRSQSPHRPPGRPGSRSCERKASPLNSSLANRCPEALKKKRKRPIETIGPGDPIVAAGQTALTGRNRQCIPQSPGCRTVGRCSGSCPGLRFPPPGPDSERPVSGYPFAARELRADACLEPVGVLRTYAMVNLISVEQISFIEFTVACPRPRA